MALQEGEDRLAQLVGVAVVRDDPVGQRDRRVELLCVLVGRVLEGFQGQEGLERVGDRLPALVPPRELALVAQRGRRFERPEREAVEAAQEAAESVAGALQEATTLPAIDPSVMTVEGFNLDAASEMIDSSNLNDLQKSTLKSTLEASQDSPVMLKVALDEARNLLGL